MNKKEKKTPMNPREWAMSEEGKKAIKEAHEESRKMIEEFRKAQTIDLRDLDRPMTI